MNVVVFEHGSYSFRDKGGACHDHAHIHVVATARPTQDFVRYVGDLIRFEPSVNWIEAAAEVVNGSACAYLALEHEGGSMIGRASGAPSGFFRKALMNWLEGNPDEHDWLVFPQADRIYRMLEAGL